MGQTMKIFIMAVLLALGFAAAVGPAMANPNLVQNGQFLSTTLNSPGGYVCNTVGTTCTSTVTDWGANCSAYGVCGNGGTPLSLLFAGSGGSAFNSNNGLNITLPNSPDGGNMIADDGDPLYRAPLFQTINGLTTGAAYNLTFYQAAAQQGGYGSATTEYWQTSLGSETLNSTTMSTPGGAVWSQQSLTFIATSTSELLNFLAIGSPAGQPPVALLADVSLTQVPEPGTFALLAAGLLGLVVAMARLRSQRSLNENQTEGGLAL